VANQEPTKAFLKWSPEMAMLSARFRCTHFGCTHFRYTHPPPPMKHNLSRLLQEVTTQDESFVLDISGYIRERVKD